MAKTVEDFVSKMAEDTWTQTAANTSFSTLSGIASGPLSDASARASAGANEALASVSNALSVIAAGVARSLEIAGSSAMTFASPNIQLALRVEAPSALDSRLFREAVSAEGSKAAFEPLPADMADLLSSSSRVLVQFVTTAFNPYGSATGVARGVPVTRLELNDFDTGLPIEVNNLKTPILFTLPAGPLGPEEDVSCRFFDANTSTFISRGCAAAPGRLPPNVTVGWNATAAALAGSLNASWEIDYLAAFPTCAHAVLDCTAAAGPREVLLDEMQPFALGAAVACPVGNVTQPRRVALFSSLSLGSRDFVPHQKAFAALTSLQSFHGLISILGPTSLTHRLFVFFGSSCPLWRPDNALKCFWNSSAQSFHGSGCIPPRVTKCACSHLTAFVGNGQPLIRTASFAQMVAVDPMDLFDKLRWLSVIVFGLFALLHLLAAPLYALDMRGKSEVMQRIVSGFGFTQHAGGAWCAA